MEINMQNCTCTAIPQCVCNVEASMTSLDTLGQSPTSSGYHKGQGRSSCVARRDSTAQGASRNSWKPGHVCLAG